jgi:hypothetical protein
LGSSGAHKKHVIGDADERQGSLTTSLTKDVEQGVRMVDDEEHHQTLSTDEEHQ